jgi:hypothetical protein
MNQQPLHDLIQQAKDLISEIQTHPEVTDLEYSPDVTLGDAQQALNELAWELNLVILEEVE